jgi:hypothetical protein
MTSFKAGFFNISLQDGFLPAAGQQSLHQWDTCASFRFAVEIDLSELILAVAVSG